MRRLTLSKAPAAAHCVWFLSDGAVWLDEQTTYAKVGHASHACNEYITKGEIPDLRAIAFDEGLDDDEAGRLRDFVRHWAAWAAEQDRRGWMPEVKLAYSLADDAGRVLTAPGPRDYSQAAPGEIVGTADLVYLREADEMYPGAPRMVVVDDYKTGFGRSVVGIKKNMQLRGLALAAARAFGVDHAMIRIVHVPEDRPVWIETDELSFFGLGKVAAQFAEIVARAERGERAHAGSWCTYCPAKGSCPETSDAIADVIPPEQLVRHKVSLAITGDDHAKWLLGVKTLLAAAVKSIDEAVKRYTDANGPLFDDDDGTIYQGWTNNGRRSIEVTPAVKAILAQVECGELVEESVAIGKLSRALGKREADIVLERIKLAGGLKTSEPGRTYEWRNAKERAA